MTLDPQSSAPSQASKRLQAWLNKRCGLHFPENKWEMLNQRLARVIERYRLDSMEALVQEVESGDDHELLAAVVHAASTNHTYFFREPHVLDYFRVNILPQLMYRDEIRIWSAAASTGDEAYTCAIIAAEALGRHALRDRVAILGTDLSGPVIESAEAGVYGLPNLEQTSPEIVARYFNAIGDGRFLVADDIRRICTFRRMNLKVRPYPFQKKFDVVFCRNVLYYFDIATQRAVLDEIYDATQPNGWLLTSVTVSLRDLGSRWTTICSGVHRKLQ
ncbi:protein-glutamate O-methyltransferase CheR [Methylocystis sp. ATCC 49242]|uniref:CheR family methyltransferase n=1 Tax=Methylocystis sp. ATCC 49242 TaxID=622637 RepID=UPI0001F87A6F|nr:protein-glutamate O-methyltransferase CheR [Methylocystis sp. ATCC 49242]